MTWYTISKQDQYSGNKTRKTTRKLFPRKKVIFTHFSALIRHVTNLLKQTNLKVVFRTIKTIQQQFMKNQAYKDPSGIHKLKCNTCNGLYVGQSDGEINVRYEEHIRNIRTNNSTSAYVKHILENKHDYRTKKTPHSLEACQRGTRMNCWEALYIQAFHQQKVLITKQQVSDTNSLLYWQR